MKFKLYHVVYPVIIEWNLAKRGIRDPAPTAYSPLSMWCKNCVKSGTYFSVFIIAAMVSKPSNALDSLWYNLTFTFFSIILHVNGV